MGKKKKQKGKKTEPGGVERAIQQAAVRVYRFLRRYLPEGCFHNAQSVREALAVLPDEKYRTEEAYYADKIGKALTVVISTLVLAVLAHVHLQNNTAVTGEGTLLRRGYGKTAAQTVLLAETDEGEKLGEYVLDLEARRYLRNEADRLFEEASACLPSLILGENESINHVSVPLTLVNSVPGYPFRITWDTGNYLRLRTDGTPVTDDVKPAGEIVMLTAHYSYADMEWEQELYVTVRAPKEDEQALMRRELESQLEQAQAETVHEEAMILPKTFRGKSLSWREAVDDHSPLLLALGLIAAFCVYAAQDNALKGRMKRRDDALAGAYPSFASQLALYMGAGMTIRGIFLKIASDYEARLADNGKVSQLHEEIRRVANELKSGVSESTSYERFAARCRLQEYAKLVSLLTQNLRKGAGGLLPLLREEAEHAVKERMDRARVRGEQASTKLMLPMMLMLAVVMLLVMVPAYMSF